MAILQNCINCCVTASRPPFTSKQNWMLLLMLQQAVSQIPLLLALRWMLHHPELLPSPPQRPQGHLYQHSICLANSCFQQQCGLLSSWTASEQRCRLYAWASCSLCSHHTSACCKVRGTEACKERARSSSPLSTWSPLLTATCFTVPLTGEETDVSIFMALSTTRAWPALTVVPAQTQRPQS